MQLGIIGLGRMGGNIARRLMRNGHEVVAHDRDAAIAQSLVADGATHVDSLSENPWKMGLACSLNHDITNIYLYMPGEEGKGTGC